MTQPLRVFLAWQCPKTRAILPIGRLVELGKADYEFCYIRAVRRAEEHGFGPLISFPHLDGVYRSAELPPVFHNRVMRKSRPDFPAFVSELLLPVDVGPLPLMARSGGRRVTDELEVFGPPEEGRAGHPEMHVLVRGVRHLPHAEGVIGALTVGERLFVMRDLQNEAGEHALMLRTESKVPVGYLPDYLAREFTGALCDRAADLTITVAKVNPAPSPVHHRLLCHVAFPAGMRVFQSDEYQPLVAGASVAA
jgi:hypothetical protein